MTDPLDQRRVSAPPFPKTKRVIARRLTLRFVLLSLISVMMCLILISLIVQISDVVRRMRDDEVAIKASLALATAVREQFMHQEHWIIEKNDEHLQHYQHWTEVVNENIRALEPLVPRTERWRLERIAADSSELNRLFQKKVMPAASRGNHGKIILLHEKSDVLSARAARHADTVASHIEKRMAHAHASATWTTRLGMLSGAVCVLLILSLSVLFRRRMRKDVFKPLEVLSAAAQRFGSGDFKTRTGALGEGELAAVASAFDRMAEELEVREQQLIESERMAAIGQLAAGVAHEINNPIQIIRGYLNTINPDASRQTLIDELKILDEEASACQRIAEDLVTYAVEPELHFDVFQMRNFLEESVQRFGETIEGKAQALHVQTEDAKVFMDGGRIRQVLMNLLLNAAQVSTEQQSIEVTGNKAVDQSYEILVSDRGPGINPEDKSKFFEPFFSQRSGGSGLGLAVAQGIVRAHGGKITVQDRNGGGSIFRISLPQRLNEKRQSA
ncbi:MAG: HAMP domain-containing protein [Myxococcales bacterium]|nr:MAG: HAMP domain-containing protein [Myxococcales bacterium]